MKRKYIFLIIEQRYLIDKCLFQLYVTRTNKNANFSLSDKQGNLSNLLLNFSFIDQKKYRILCRTEKKKRKRICILATTELSQNDRKPTMNHLFPSTPASTTNNFFLYFTRNNWKEKKKKKQNSSLLTAKSSQLSLEF